MDPQANAREQSALSRLLLEQCDRGEDLDPDDVARLAELVLALAEWQARGGFPPDWADTGVLA